MIKILLSAILSRIAKKLQVMCNLPACKFWDEASIWLGDHLLEFASMRREDDEDE